MEPAGLADPFDRGRRLGDGPDQGIVDAEGRELVEEGGETGGAGIQPEGIICAGSRIVEPDADRPAERQRIAAGRRAGGLAAGEPRHETVVHAAEPGRVPRVGPGGGQPEHPLALRGDEDGDAP